MDEFRALLDRFWIRREEDRELFIRCAANCLPCAGRCGSNSAGK